MSGGARATSGPEAARSQDFLYGEDGLPKSGGDPAALRDRD